MEASMFKFTYNVYHLNGALRFLCKELPKVYDLFNQLCFIWFLKENKVKVNAFVDQRVKK